MPISRILGTAAALVLLLSSSSVAFSQTDPSQMKGDVRFTVYRPDPVGLWQVVGMCDGPRSAATLRCHLLNILIDRAGRKAVEMKEATRDECEMNVIAEGMLVFERIEPGVWRAVSPVPGAQCGEVSTYTLKMEKSGIWFTLSESTINTSRGAHGICQQGAAAVVEYQPAYLKPPKMQCDGVTFGLIPGS